ncbi:TAXI family TRAP transporter solute-binding subunit [Marinobacter mobilis]|uniref:TAXI family TRAP transporter solute-binding subunit n=1 Tax=Marinobacter mobilis TaxID=488533 RepID=UPI0035C71B30
MSQNIRVLITAATLSATVLSSNAIASDRADWPQNFTVGTASQGGTYFAYGSGWANYMSENLGISGGAEITGGPVQNMALVHTGDLGFGLTTMGPASEALEGKSPLAPGMKLDNVCAMFPMYQTPFSVTVLTNSGITRIADIPEGARIGFGPAGSTSDTYFPRMMDALGVQYERRNGSWADLGGQLQDGLIDVVAFAAGIPIPAVSQLEVQSDIRIIEFNEDEVTRITAEFPVAPFTIPANTYSSLNADSQAVSMWNFAVAGCDVPEELVYEMTRLTLENNDKMVSIHKAATTSVAENYVHNTVIPWHPGAARWFNENGYTIDVSQIK